MQLVTLFTKVEELHRQVSSVELQPSKSASAKQLEAQSTEVTQRHISGQDRQSRLSLAGTHHALGNWRLSK